MIIMWETGRRSLVVSGLWSFVLWLPARYVHGGLYLDRKEGNVLFNDALNTFYLRLYGVRHMVKDHSDSEKENRCRHIGYSF